MGWSKPAETNTTNPGRQPSLASTHAESLGKGKDSNEHHWCELLQAILWEYHLAGRLVATLTAHTLAGRHTRHCSLWIWCQDSSKILVHVCKGSNEIYWICKVPKHVMSIRQTTVSSCIFHFSLTGGSGISAGWNCPQSVRGASLKKWAMNVFLFQLIQC